MSAEAPKTRGVGSTIQRFRAGCSPQLSCMSQLLSEAPFELLHCCPDEDTVLAFKAKLLSYVELEETDTDANLKLTVN